MAFLHNLFTLSLSPVVQNNTDPCLSNPCQNGGKCERFTNKFNCTCLAGFTGDKCETGG